MGSIKEHTGKIILDLGCLGENKYPNSIGIDAVDGPGVDIVYDLNKGIPFDDNSVDLIYASHFLEHIDNFFYMMKEIYRVIKKEGQIIIKVPHFTSCRAHSDPTHKRVFGIYSFDYFNPEFPLHFYYQIGNTKFKVIKKEYKFHYGFLSRFLELFFNKFQHKYERYLCYLFPCFEMIFILKPMK